jgi:hypothetical protein
MPPKPKAKSTGPKPGTEWDGPNAYVTDYGLVDRPGFYALDEDGKELLDPPVRLVMVDDEPGDEWGTRCHLEVASDKDPPMKQAERIVDLEADAQGSAQVEP